MKRTPFKRKSWQEILAKQYEKKLKINPEILKKGYSGPDMEVVYYTDKKTGQRGKLRRSTLNAKGKGATSLIKDEIQGLLRKIAILRDGGCVLRDCPDTGKCFGWKNNGELVLQAEHLISRSHSNTYGDMRNIVCLCSGHHGTFKPNNSMRYWNAIERVIGPSRWTWVKRNEEDYARKQTYKMDWKMVKYSLEQELKTYETKNN